MERNSRDDRGSFSFPPLPILPTPALIGRMSDRALLELCVRYLSVVPDLRDLYEKVWVQQVANEERITRLEAGLGHVGAISTSAWRKWERTAAEMKKSPNLPDIDDSRIIPPDVVRAAQERRYLRDSDATFLRGARSIWSKAWPEAVKMLVTAIIVSLAWMIWHLASSGHLLP